MDQRVVKIPNHPKNQKSQTILNKSMMKAMISLIYWKRKKSKMIMAKRQKTTETRRQAKSI